MPCRDTICRVTPLQELILDRLAELNLSYRAAADRTKGSAHEISFGTINQLANGRGGPVTDRTVRGLAKALDVPVGKVRLAVGRSETEPTEFLLPEKAKHLTPRQRKAILHMVDALLDQQKTD